MLTAISKRFVLILYVQSFDWVIDRIFDRFKQPASIEQKNIQDAFNVKLCS